METLKADLKSLLKENESLRFMVEVMKSKCKILEAHLQETKAVGQMDMINFTQINGFNKRVRTSDQVPVVHNYKTQRILVRTDSDQDNSLVSLLHIHIYIWSPFLC